jgi:hypothetical protein
MIGFGKVGGACNYDIYIPREEHPCGDKILGGVILSSQASKTFLHFNEIFVTREHLRLSPGYERYDQWKALEKKAIDLEDQLLREHFPELRGNSKNNLSMLWVTGISLPSVEEWADIEIPALVVA